jgi:hypothetical protein
MILHKLKLGVELTALTAEHALECTYITSHGVFHECIPLEDWPFYKINDIECGKLPEIIEKVKTRSLSPIDLKNTWLEELYHAEVGADSDLLNDFFSNVISIITFSAGEAYAHVRDEVAYFFETQIEFERDFESHIAPEITCWEDMSDDELAEWFERVANETPTFPMTEI